jgi:hypothetical protein
MRTCYQTKGLTILEHGESVYAYYFDLHNYLFNDTLLTFEWRLPEWIDANKEFIKANLLPLDILREYQIFHDCGKPQCVTIDELGKTHFPNHAEVSMRRWTECTEGSTRNTQIGALIGMDMDIHLLKADALGEFIKRPEAISLLITGLSEIHSNAAMFGGIESTSFKIKWKHIDKRGRQIINTLQDKNG